ncbi:MAG: 1-deoxy-D-xylulose-5-phosphate synthase [Clostridia bacterium]|nr:1-deoxy-D-xylulose-5-phosphate synthase [Clostridia bacterium]
MLEQIHTPADLKKLNHRQLKQLAQEIREFLVESVSRTGGHLAPSLGVVELTIALHYVLDCPEDDLIFDVGHQAYVHKILTGRKERFSTLRQKDGLSGFPRPEESEYDAFSVGHASTAISVALGMARTHQIMHSSSTVVAVVGDGAMTGGMCYEALNDAGQSDTPLIVILNDNDMSISHNVGALSAYLTHMRHSRWYHDMKRGVRDGLMKLPFLGEPTFRVMEKLRDGLRALLTDGAFFDSLGFEYWGPIDGHNIPHLIRELERAKRARRPILMHVVTKKGMGYAPAEQDPAKFHGCGAFDPQTGALKGDAQLSAGELVARQLKDMADLNIRIAAITAAMKRGTGLTEFASAHPDRFFDVGIAEEHAVTMAAGMASRGMHPYVAIYSTFLQRAFDQLMMDVCIDAYPVTLLVDRSGLNGADGVTHQGVFDISYLRALPHMIVASPRDVRELKRMVALSEHVESPMAIRYSRDPGDLGPCLTDQEPLQVGKWEKMLEGTDAMILAVGRMVQVALQAAAEMAPSGLSCGVIDARFIKPMDREMLREAASREGRLLVTLEDNVLAGGFGSGVDEQLSAWALRPDVLHIAVPDAFIPHASIAEQLEMLHMDAAGVAEQIRARLKRD